MKMKQQEGIPCRKKKVLSRANKWYYEEVLQGENAWGNYLDKGTKL